MRWPEKFFDRWWLTHRDGNTALGVYEGSKLYSALFPGARRSELGGELFLKEPRRIRFSVSLYFGLLLPPASPTDSGILFQIHHPWTLKPEASPPFAIRYLMNSSEYFQLYVSSVNEDYTAKPEYTLCPATTLGDLRGPNLWEGRSSWDQNKEFTFTVTQDRDYYTVSMQHGSYKTPEFSIPANRDLYGKSLLPRYPKIGLYNSAGSKTYVSAKYEMMECE